MKKSKKGLFFTEKLMHWNLNHNKRSMPWKGESDPYKIWLSEIILQQTRVEQGLNYYERFIKKFPTVHILARADENDVFKLWEGLGYYSRCKNLIATARQIAFEATGIFPDNYEAILKLKGVGPYTAAAISSFAYDLPYAVADGNVVRVLARYFGAEIPIDTNEGRIYFKNLSQTLLDKRSPALYNQAIMDLGATICRPKLPLCNECVLQSKCTAYKKNSVALLPVKVNRLIKRHRYFYYIIAEYDNKIYVRKRTGKDIWQNLWEFILVEKDERISANDFLGSEEFLRTAGTNFRLKSISDIVKQQLTHQNIEGIFISIILQEPLKNENYSAINAEEIGKRAFPGLITRFKQKSLPVVKDTRSFSGNNVSLKSEQRVRKESLFTMTPGV